MTGADITYCSVDGSGVGTIKDAKASAKSTPADDATQDSTLIESSEVSGATTFVFQRNLDTTDTTGDIVIAEGTHIIFAHSPDNSDTMAYHTTNKGGLGTFTTTVTSTPAPAPSTPAPAPSTPSSSPSPSTTPPATGNPSGSVTTVTDSAAAVAPTVLAAMLALLALLL
eukprot:GFYU01001926.1.p1 GENE.GFYU01001926.1~~GFYU01001926.1.p1  ORF type:complete len:169 (+),score=63.34 GFYU01001926.1:209-715(+)